MKTNAAVGGLGFEIRRGLADLERHAILLLRLELSPPLK